MHYSDGCNNIPDVQMLLASLKNQENENSVEIRSLR